MKKHWILTLGLSWFLAFALGNGVLAQDAQLPSAVDPANIIVNTTDDELNSDDDCSLREAITIANTNVTVGADTIMFSVTGTITLGSALPNITDYLTIVGPGAANLTISGNKTVRVLAVNPGITLNLQGVTVANGKGGGIINSGGALMITESAISNNKGTDGAGILNGNGGTVKLVNSAVSNNIADGYGGGIYNNGALTITNSTISDNSAQSYIAGWGGGIFNRGTLIVMQTTISGNISDGFGSMGGGILNQGTATITNSTFSGNRAVGGGGIHTYRPVTITSCTFSNNSAKISWGGGAISSYGGIVILRNTIVANSPMGENCYANPFLVINGGNNLQFPGQSCGSTIPSADPLLGPLQDNDGPTLTHALLAGSPAINAVPLANCPIVATDQRGVTRPQGSACDIGAFEFVANQPPTADAGGPYSVNEGASVNVDALGNDPENGLLTYAWDLDNNGTFETPAQSVTISTTTLDGPGSHIITVQVTDNGGLTATDQATVNVVNVAPTATFTGTPSTIIVGQSATLSFSKQFDPSAADVATGFKYSYDCTSDGTFEIGDGDGTSSYTCPYPASGTFTATGRIKDKDGGFTDYTVQVVVLTSKEATESLINQVQALIDAGTLNEGQGNALISKLLVAIKKLDKGPAIQLLQAFIDQVNDFMSSTPPILTAAEGQPLIDAANAIIAALSTTGKTAYLNSGSSDDMIKTEGALPTGYRLEQNSPNPFNPVTAIQFSVPRESYVRLKVYNSFGAEVATLVDRQVAAGTYKVNWDASRLASGFYLYRLEAKGFAQTKKLLLMK